MMQVAATATGCARAISNRACGLSLRDTEDAFKDEEGRLLLSRTAVSEMGERLWQDYQYFSKRDLSEHDIADLFVDGIAERIGLGSGASRCWQPGAFMAGAPRSCWR